MYYHARYYDAALGRFIGADTLVPDSPSMRLSPLTVNFSHSVFVEELGREHRWSTQLVGRGGGMVNNEVPRGLSIVQSFQKSPILLELQTSGPADPQNLNRYAYVRNNPLRYIDPSGYWTFGFGFGFTLGFGGGISASIMLVFDDNGNIGLAISGGGGGYAGIGGSGGIVVQVTNADTIRDLNGTVVQTGGSGGIGLSGGLEWVAQNGPTDTNPNGPINGVNFNFGPGLQGNGVTPFEFHSMVEGTKVIEIRLLPRPEEIDWW